MQSQSTNYICGVGKKCVKQSVRCTDGGEQISRTGVSTDTVNLILDGTFKIGFNTILCGSMMYSTKPQHKMSANFQLIDLKRLLPTYLIHWRLIGESWLGLRHSFACFKSQKELRSRVLNWLKNDNRS